MSDLIKLIDISPMGDDRGMLFAIEANKSIPFEIRRVYYISGTKPGAARGFHAHKALKQVAVCLTGSCRILLDDGQVKDEILLDSPAKGLVIEDLVWREMHDFTPDCILLVLASEHYNEADYIRDYESFLEIAKGML